MEYGAVLIIGHFIVSIFQVPLGQPLWQFVPYPSMEICQSQIQYHVLPQQGFPLSTEYKMYKTAECMTKEAFEAEMERQRKLMEQPKPQDGWSFD